MNVTLLPPGHPAWDLELDALGLQLGAPDNSTLFPYHYLSVVFQRIGGQIVLVDQGDVRIGIGFLFPRYEPDGNIAAAGAYTLRYHPVYEMSGIDPDALVTIVSNVLGGSKVVFYDPMAAQEYAPTHVAYGELDIGRPEPYEIKTVRELQATIWGSPPEFLYPSDIHSVGFGAATSLVARFEEKAVGYLLGMYKFGGPGLPIEWSRTVRHDIRLESQSMGVLPEYRGRHIAYLLKRAQGKQAQREGIGVVHWTVDPLQYPNAVLNFGLLRAVAFNFYPDLYPFRNQLNRVHPSRLAITWLVGSQRVLDVPLYDVRARVLDLSHHPELERVNQGWANVNFTLGGPLIAIEIPRNWTQLQAESIAEAQQWREATDRIFAHYIGRQGGDYVLTGVGREEERRFLIAERVDDALWSALGR